MRYDLLSVSVRMQTVAAVSPNAAKLINLGAPQYVQNAPFTVGVSQTGVGITNQLFNVGPCLIAIAEQGVNINPILIQVSPRLIQIDAIGVQIQPEVITVDPTLINIGPNGALASLAADPPAVWCRPRLHSVPCMMCAADLLRFGIEVCPPGI